MSLTINNFEDDIHALILSRGKEYFSKSLVHNLQQSDGGWVATVGDESRYKVVLEGDKTFEQWYCECPFDHGPICKHVVAAILSVKHYYQYIQEEINLSHTILDKIPGEELSLFTKAYLEQNQVFRKHFLATYYGFDEEK